jgi:hypothetical protein
MKYNSETVYYLGFSKNLTLNERYPNNSYRGMNLCEKCYREVYENAPALPIENSAKDEVMEEEENSSNDSDAHSGMILASKILSDSSILDDLKDKYLVIYDQALAGLKFDNLNRAINVMAKEGWKCINITSYNAAGQAIFSQAIYMYALMEKLDKFVETKTS